MYILWGRFVTQILLEDIVPLEIREYNIQERHQQGSISFESSFFYYLVRYNIKKTINNISVITNNEANIIVLLELIEVRMDPIAELDVDVTADVAVFATDFAVVFAINADAVVPIAV
jgi:hypothetical protein